MTIDSAIKALGCLILSNSCYVLGLAVFCCVVVTYHVGISKLVLTMPSLSPVTLLGLVLSSWCYAAWSSVPQTGLLDLPYLMLLCWVFFISDRVMLFGFVFMMLRGAILLGIQSFCWSSKNGFCNYKFFFLAPAAKLVNHNYVQLENNTAEVRRPNNLQILWWILLSKTQLIFIKQKPTQIYCIFVSLPQRVGALLQWRDGTGTTSNLFAFKQRQHLVSLVYKRSAPKTLSVHSTPAPSN